MVGKFDFKSIARKKSNKEADSHSQSNNTNSESNETKEITVVEEIKSPVLDENAIIIDIRTIKEDFQIRTLFEKQPEAYSNESISELAKIIKNDSPIDFKIGQPILLAKKEDGYYLREGKRRTLACKMLAEQEKNPSWFFQPAQCRSDVSGEDIELFQYNINNSKQTVDLRTTVFLFKKKIEEGWTQADIARLSCYSTSKVSKIMKILTYPHQIQQRIFDENLGYYGEGLNKALKALSEHGSDSVDANKESISLNLEQIPPKKNSESKPKKIKKISLDKDIIFELLDIYKKLAIENGFSENFNDFNEKSSNKDINEGIKKMVSVLKNKKMDA